PWGSFEGWSDTVRSAVVWAGLPDPGLTRVGLARSDPKRSAIATLISYLANAPANGWLASQIIGQAMSTSPTQEQIALKEALLSLCSTDNNLLPNPVGQKLGSLRDKVVGGYRLTIAKEDNQGRRWRAVPVDPDGCVAAPSATVVAPSVRCGA